MQEPLASLDEEEDAKQQAVARGIADAEAGRVVPHEAVREWLRDLARGKRSPKPR